MDGGAVGRAAQGGVSPQSLGKQGRPGVQVSQGGEKIHRLAGNGVLLWGEARAPSTGGVSGPGGAAKAHSGHADAAEHHHCSRKLGIDRECSAPGPAREAPSSAPPYCLSRALTKKAERRAHCEERFFTGFVPLPQRSR